MTGSGNDKKHSKRSDASFPVSPPVKPPTKQTDARRDSAPDLHIEEIEEKHIPKDRNIFDK
jgi:hypothetical protein